MGQQWMCQHHFGNTQCGYTVQRETQGNCFSGSLQYVCAQSTCTGGRSYSKTMGNWFSSVMKRCLVPVPPQPVEESYSGRRKHLGALHLNGLLSTSLSEEEVIAPGPSATD
eukprot:6866802-Ditylum_brightwellii.AAC.1